MRNKHYAFKDEDGNLVSSLWSKKDPGEPWFEINQNVHSGMVWNESTQQFEEPEA